MTAKAYIFKLLFKCLKKRALALIHVDSQVFVLP